MVTLWFRGVPVELLPMNKGKGYVVSPVIRFSLYLDGPDYIMLTCNDDPGISLTPLSLVRERCA